MHTVIVAGSGHIGLTIAYLLAQLDQHPPLTTLSPPHINQRYLKPALAFD